MSTLTLRYMRPADIPQVVDIDNHSFDPPWSARSYAYEVGESSYSHMVVLERTVAALPASGWRRWLRGLNNHHETQGMIVGYGGLWNIVDEGHISTIAAHPAWRGQGFGEILLVGMIHRAVTLGAAYIVLEVRVSNTVAQRLYEKYEFETTGTKANYYRNNNEDAYEMRLDLNNEGLLARMERRYQAIQARQPFADFYTAADPVLKR